MKSLLSTSADILTKQIVVFDGYHFALTQVFFAFVVYVIASGVNYVIKRIIFKQEKRKHIDVGKGFAIYKIFKYITYTIAFMIILEVMGVKITILLAGSAALLVGLGLGIQQIFYDTFSGILLLFEGSISVEDVIEVNGVVGKVERIDIRTSIIRTRDDITIIIPNSKIIGDNVINWTHNRTATRFHVTVGVAYGSDLQLVKKLLEQAAISHSKVEKTPAVFVRFENFGNSSLDFSLFFWIDQMENMFRVESVKSDIRFEIDRLFRAHQITIPFPQTDVHLKQS